MTILRNDRFSIRRKVGSMETLVAPVGAALVEAEALFTAFSQKQERIAKLEAALLEAKQELFLVAQEDCKEHVHHVDYCTQESFTGYGFELCLRCGKVVHV